LTLLSELDLAAEPQPKPPVPALPLNELIVPVLIPSHFCDSKLCECERPFFATHECEAGRLARCMFCGERRLIPFERTNSGVA